MERSSRIGFDAWLQRVETTMRAVHGVGVEHLLEREATLAEWHAMNVEPELLVHRVDKIDIAIARWLAQFGESTWRTYERALRQLASDMALSVAPTARALLRRASSQPDAVARLVTGYVKRHAASTGTLRLRLSALRSAMHALHVAGLAKPFHVASPDDVDVDLSVPTSATIDRIDNVLARASEHDALAARTRAELRLAVDGLRAHEICELCVENVRLSAVVVGDEVVRLSHETSEALCKWLSIRGTKSGVLFVAFESKLRHLGTRRLTTRALERDIQRASSSALTMRALRRFAVVTAFRDGGWSSGERVARLTHINGVTRMVKGARQSARGRNSKTS